MLHGVIEGFYGRPYTSLQRRIIIRYLSCLEKPAFVYAPKNDPFHRLRWREDYPEDSWLQIKKAIEFTVESEVEFYFGISPWKFDDKDCANLRRKAGRALNAGAKGIAVLFDDIPEKADASLAERQINLAGEALEGIGCGIYLCPSIYCFELLDRYDGGEYLREWRKSVPAGWSSFWTGNSVISRDLNESGMMRAEELLGSKPVIWDNLLADDYCLRRIYLAGLNGRIPEGYSYFLNPSSCFPVALHAVYMLLKALDANCKQPSELGGNPEAWDILSGFHYLPWSADDGVESLLVELRRAAYDGPSAKLMERLRSISEALGSFIDSLEEIEGGFDLMPYVTDIKKFTGWWEGVLALASPSERLARLEYLMYERLPFDHPVSTITAGLLMKNRKGER